MLTRQKHESLALTVTGLVLLLIITTSAHIPALQGDFFSDDLVYIVENQPLQSTPPSYWWQFLTKRMNPLEYLPVRDLSYKIEYELFGLNPLAYKIDNLILYLLNCIAVWFAALIILNKIVLKKTGPKKTKTIPSGEQPNLSVYWLAFAITALFAVHPAHVESIAWISGRKDLLSGLFSILSITCFVHAYKNKQFDTKLIALSCGLFILALLSKSTPITLPIITSLIAYALIVEKNRRTRIFLSLKSSLPLILISAIFLFFIVDTGKETGVKSAIDSTHDLRDNKLLAAVQTLGYLTKIAVTPLQLRLIYDYSYEPVRWLTLLAGGIAFILIAYCVYRFIKKPTATILGILIFFVFSIPFLQFIHFNSWSVVSERFLFLPTFGLAITGGLLLAKLKSKTGYTLLAFILVTGLYITFERSQDWRSDTTLWQSNAKITPTSFSAINYYVNVVLIPQDQFEMAIKATEQVTNLTGKEYLVQLINLRKNILHGNTDNINAYLNPLLTQHIELFYSNMKSYNTVLLANLGLKYGDLSGAENAYRYLLTKEPDNTAMYYNLGLVLMKKNNWHAAINTFLKITKDKKLPIEMRANAWNKLGSAYKKTQQHKLAQKAYNDALSIDPKHWHAGYNLAQMISESGNNSLAKELLAKMKIRAINNNVSTVEIDTMLKQIITK